MRVEIGIVLLFVAVAYATETPSSSAPAVNSAYDYHRRFGIPQAQKIKKIEDEIHSGQRITGGSMATTISVPYQAGIIMTMLIFTSVCGGALINPDTVVTAAGCYDDGVLLPTSITVVLGSNFLFTGGTRTNEVTVTAHPDFKPQEGVANNIAVVRLKNQVTFSLTMQPIETPLFTNEISNTFVGHSAVASGYGITADGESVSLLQTISSTQVQVISNDECASIYPGVVQNTHLCTSGAGGAGICDGDIGGPLVVSVGLFRKILVGIGSFYAANGCQLGFPSGFTRVTSYLGWIYSV